jgi:hypothetical protein
VSTDGASEAPWEEAVVIAEIDLESNPGLAAITAAAILEAASGTAFDTA